MRLFIWCAALASAAVLNCSVSTAHSQSAGRSVNAIQREPAAVTTHRIPVDAQCGTTHVPEEEATISKHATWGPLLEDSPQGGGFANVLDGFFSAVSVRDYESLPWHSIKGDFSYSTEPVTHAISCARIQTATVVKEGQGRTQGLPLNASAALVIDQDQWQSLYAKEPSAVRPIASITKLMTAMVVLDAGLPSNELILIQRPDIDTLKRSSSRLSVGIRLTRAELLRLALMASENRAASALAGAYPGGKHAFVTAMNRKAHQLGMRDSRFVDPTGLNPGNVSSALDLAIMVNAAYQYPAIREATTMRERIISLSRGRRLRTLTFHNSNRLLDSEEWEIGLSKTGYIREAGRCLVMQSVIGSKPVIIVLLDSMKKATRIADANYIRHWLSQGMGMSNPRTSGPNSIE